MSATLAVAGLSNITQVLGQTENGQDILALARRLRLVGGHSATADRMAFPANVADLTPAQLSNTQSYWAAEHGHVLELQGLLLSQKVGIELRLKAARSRARAQVRRDIAADENAKKPTNAEIDDRIVDDPAVSDIVEEQMMVEQLLAVVGAARDVTDRYLQVLSREISFRSVQIDRGIYA